MEKQFEIIRQTRKFLLNLVSDLSLEELNEIPPGFNNNIIWNLGHIVAAQAGVCYVRGGFPLPIDEKFFLAYKPDSKPTGPVSEAEFDAIKEMMFSTIDTLMEDYKNNAFEGYKPWMNRYGVEHTSIDDSIIFLPFHEGLHMGYIMAQKRALKSKMAIQ
jgi:hypothetical protein